MRRAALWLWLWFCALALRLQPALPWAQRRFCRWGQGLEAPRKAEPARAPLQVCKTSPHVSETASLQRAAAPGISGFHLHPEHRGSRLPQTVATNVPPEDQDGSGDDSDNFSGSGAGALQDISLLHQTTSTWKDMWLLTTVPTAPEPTDVETVAASILPTVEEPDQEGSVRLMELEPGLTVQEETSHPPSKTTQHPTTHQASTARVSTAQAPATTDPPRDMQPGHHKTSAPTGHEHFYPHSPSQEEGGPSATEKAAEDGASSQLPVGEGSGEQDFIFENPGDNTVVAAVEPDQRNQAPVDQGATGASQGLLDRKEVLGGVIAGGLVGLIFAVCLVGFMLYRMKKKDEGSYSLEEPKQANGGAYQKPTKQEEFYA
ncbi:syndecan-1 [Orycteropus afer afer]|uniref:Syndecan n=1 Tax=Orycteropus afer afer TaxID=1230840 RepID=A0A8B6ZQT9_ORYAF|nr:syndecan-1 [Orycteropus afer afer]